MRRKPGTLNPPPPPAPVVPPLRKAIYVSNFNLICGYFSEEDALLAWCQTNGINTLFLYDMSSVWATTYAPFVAFYDKAKTYGITKIFAQRGSEARHIGSGFSSTKSYNLANPTRRVHFGFENEFWNYEPAMVGTSLHFANKAAFPAIGEENTTYIDDSDATLSKYWLWQTSQYVKLINQSTLMDAPDANGNIIYRNWIKAQTKIYLYAKSVGLESDFYIGHLRDYVEGTTAATIAAQTTAVVDTIEISWYVSTAEFLSSDNGLNYLRDRLNQLGTAGIAAGKKVNLVIIYAGNSPYMDAWFATVGNTLLKALNISISIINTNPLGQLTAKAGFFVAGFQGYAISRT